MSDEGRATWVGQVEVTLPFVVEPVTQPLSERYDRARVWIRFDSRPIGWVEVPVTGGNLDRAVIVQAVAEYLESGTVAIECVEGGGHLAELLDGGIRPSIASSAGTMAEEAISVILATKARAASIGTTLKSLATLEYPCFEVCVVDGTLDESTKTVFDDSVRNDQRFRYFRERAPGLSRARNRGMIEARHQLVAFTDDDGKVDRYWLSRIAGRFGESQDIACVTGMVPAGDLSSPAQRYFDQRVWWSRFLEPKCYTATRRLDDPPLHPYQLGLYGTGANFALRRSAALAVGGFSELLGAGSPCHGGGEDADMFVRLLLAGWSLAYEPSAIVWHQGRESTEELARQLREYGRGTLVTGLKWLVDPKTRPDVLRRLPRAAWYYMGLLLKKGRSAESGQKSMAMAELAGVPSGVFAFARGYSVWRREKDHLS